METTGKPNVIKCPFVWSCCSLFSGFILAQLALCFLDLFTLNQAPLSLFLSSLACPEVQVSFKDTPSPQPFQAKAVFPVPTLVPQPWRWGSCPWFFLLLPNTVKPPITEFSANTRFYTYHLHIFLALGVYSFFSKTVSLELTVFPTTPTLVKICDASISQRQCILYWVSPFLDLISCALDPTPTPSAIYPNYYASVQIIHKNLTFLKMLWTPLLHF